MGVFRIEHSARMPRRTTLLIAAPLLDMVPLGDMSILDEVAVRIKNLVVDGQLPLEHPDFYDTPTMWCHAGAGNSVFERSVRSVLESLESNHLSADELKSLKTILQTLPTLAYRFDFDTDPRFVNRGLSMIHDGLFGSLMELASRRRSMIGRISDMCGGL